LKILEEKLDFASIWNSAAILKIFTEQRFFKFFSLNKKKQLRFAFDKESRVQ
jgi:hypothetical protein